MSTQNKKRIRRTEEQMIADLESEIERLRKKAVTRETKTSDEGKAFLGAVRAVDKAIEAARATRNDEMVRALESARATLAEQMIRMGIRLTKSRRGRRPKSAEVA